VTDNDSTKNRVYYPSLEKFAEARILEQMKEADKSIREHEMPDELFTFKVAGDL